MQFILNLLGNPAYIEFPFQLAGWLSWLILASLLVVGVIRLRDWKWMGELWRWGVFFTLLIATPLASLFLGLRLPVENVAPVPGIPLEPTAPALMLLSAVPWVLAAGILGPASAALLAACSGLLIAIFESHSLFTPLELAGLALIYSISVRQRYRTPTFRIVSHPIVAAFFSVACFIPVYLLIALLGSKGSLASRIDYAFTQSWVAMGLRLVEVVIASLVGEGLVLSQSPIWGKRSPLEPSPSETHLEMRFFYRSVPVILVMVLTLMISDWVVAGRSAERMIQDRLASTSRVASDSLPYFLETGQNLILTLADPSLLEMFPSSIEGALSHRLRSVPYFRQLFLFDRFGNEVSGYPVSNFSQLQPSSQERSGIQLALKGVPVQIYTVTPWPGETTAQVSFVATIREVNGDIAGVIVGRTDLKSNPFTQPAVQALDSVMDLSGDGYILDEKGTILYHSQSSRVMNRYPIDISDQPRFFKETSSQGASQMVYYQPVTGRPWSVILTVPSDQAQQQALAIAIPMLVLLLALSGIVFFFIRWGLRGVSISLRNLAHEATLIAQGQLGNPLTITGEDEIGHFGRAFEKMRVSLRDRLEELNRLLSVSQGVASTLEVEQAVKPILMAAMGDSGSAARIVLVSEVSLEAPKTPFVAIGVGPAADSIHYLDAQIFDLMRKQNLMVVPNGHRTRRLIYTNGHTVPGALIAMPILHESVYLGALWVAYDSPHNFSEEEIRFLGTLVGQAIMAAVNARLYASSELGRQRLEAVLASTPEPVMVIDAQMNLLLLNPAALQVPGLVSSSQPGQPIREIIQQPDLLDLIGQPLKDKAISREISLSNGRTYSASISPVIAEGALAGKVCLLRDITHYVELDSMKSDFVSTVSHDLRSPLTLVRGYATMLQMVGELNDQQKTYITKITSGIESMSKLVTNLLDLGRIEAGVGLKIETINANEIIETVISSLTPQAVQKKIKIKFDPDSGNPPARQVCFQADASLLQQGVFNLLENAIKYTPVSGEVEILLRQVQGKVIFEVHDNGIGIAPLDLPHMFEKFYRSGRREAHHQRGTGLGLAIVKSIAERHKGRVWVESQLGKGSTFFLAIPESQAS